MTTRIAARAPLENWTPSLQQPQRTHHKAQEISAAAKRSLLWFVAALLLSASCATADQVSPDGSPIFYVGGACVVLFVLYQAYIDNGWD